MNLDADDLLLPGRVARLVSTMASTDTDLATDSLELFPGYLDARLNLEEAAPTHLTSHPLRRQPSRSEY